MNVQLKKILCPVDFSRNAAYATQYAMAFAEAHESEVLLLQVEEPYVPCVPMAYPGIDGLVPICTAEDTQSPDRRDENKGRVDDSLESLASDLRKIHKNVPIRTLKASGKPFVEIVRAARDQNADLILMGTHGRTGLAHMLIGSTAEKVVRMAPCPVLTVKHPEHEFVMP
jgi:nucleotide-binding universal stress UspA family protein